VTRSFVFQAEICVYYSFVLYWTFDFSTKFATSDCLSYLCSGGNRSYLEKVNNHPNYVSSFFISVPPNTWYIKDYFHSFMEIVFEMYEISSTIMCIHLYKKEHYLHAHITEDNSRPQFHLSLLGSLASLRTYRHLAARVGTSKGGGKQLQTTSKSLPRMQFYAFYVLLTVHLDTSVCNKNQLDALFILSLFRQSASTCFGHICRPSSGSILYIYNNWYVLCSIFQSLVPVTH
jgi:hypothetical protein